MHTITITGDQLSANAIGIAEHNLSGVSISVYANSNLVRIFTPTNAKPFLGSLVDFGEDPIIADVWEVVFDTTEQVKIAVLKLGVSISTQRPCKYVGHQPATMARTAEISPAKSMRGQFLGGRAVWSGNRTSVEIENLKPDWVREHLDMFLVHAITRAYFFAWRLEQYPDEVMYGWTHDVIVPTNQRSNGMMSVGWEIEGVA